MLPLYPPIKPYKTHKIHVSGNHQLYVEETGNPQGLPVIVLHSGPGGASLPELRRFFDPEQYRIIIFDQRGCGRSTPHGHIENNTTQDLLDDIDTIRAALNIERFVLSGGGWGSTLALLYAEMYPQHIKALILHRIYLARMQDINWFYQQGANLIFPDFWADLISTVPQDMRHDIPTFYAQRLQGTNELARMAAAKNWAYWQAQCSGVQPDSLLIDTHSEPHFALALALIETHFITHRYFIKENQILDEAHKIRHIPCYIIHGRYDIVCPYAGAWLLNQALPASELFLIREAGHSIHEPPIVDALILASKEILNQESDVC